MNIIATSYVQLPLEFEATTLEIVVNPFQLFPTTVSVRWAVSGLNGYKEGTLELPQSIVDQWGTDDSIVEEYVLQQLNLYKDNTTTTTTLAPPQ